MAYSEKRVQVKIEVGHQAVCRVNLTPTGHTHDWSIFVRGAEGAEIHYFIEKVVFHLHESFPKPKRVIKEPPYRVSESGYGSFTLKVEIYFRNKEDPRKVRFDYDLTLQIVGMPPLNITKVEALTFLNPSEDFEKKLLKGGAVVLSSSGTSPSSNGVKADPNRTASPASSHGSSPSTAKKQQLHSSSKPKPKDSAQSAKRSNSVSDETFPKAKKKKIEKHDISNPSLKEIPILNPATEAVDSIKMPKSSVKKIKERRKSTEPVNGVSGSPKYINKEGRLKGKEMKIKKEKEKKSEKKVSPDKEGMPKIQKFIFKRTADDAWSTTSNVETNGASTQNTAALAASAGTAAVLNNAVTTTGKQNMRVDALLAEFAEEGSTSDDEMHIVVPNEEVKQNKQTPEQFNYSTSSSNSGTTTTATTTTKPRKSKVHNQIITNGKLNTSKKDALKKSRTTTEIAKPVQNGKALNMSSQELVEMYKKINNIENTDALQQLVDIVENTGTFEISSTTFEFDLCVLDTTSLNAIKHVLDNT